MRIGSEENFLRIETLDTRDPYSPCSFEAKITSLRAQLYAINDAVMFESTEKVIEDLKSFHLGSTNNVELNGTEGCKLSLARLARGQIKTSFIISHWKFGDNIALHGEITIDGEYSNSFVKSLQKIIQQGVV